MTLKSKDIFNNEFYSINRRFLVIVGLWPYQKTILRDIRIFQICVVMVISISGQLRVLQLTKMTVELISEALETLLPTVCVALGYFNMLHKYTTIKKALDCVRYEWEKLPSEDESTVLEMYACKSKQYTQVFACVTYLYITCLTFPSVLRHILYIFGQIDYSELTLPLRNDEFLKNEIKYFGILWFQVISLVVICTVTVAYYTMFVLFLQHACALFNVVSIRLGRPFKKSEKECDTTSTLVKPKDEFNWIVSVIKSNNDALYFVELMKLLYEGSSIAELIITCLVVIINFIYVFQLLDFMLTMTEVAKISYIICTMVMTWGYLYLGQKLIDVSMDVHTKCMLIPFYQLSIKTQKLFLVLTMRAMKPCCLSVGGLISLSHQLFPKLIRMSFSFATLFNNKK